MLFVILAVANDKESPILWHAICAVESGCKADAIGDGGNAVGIAQIWPICVDDVNRICGTPRFTYADRLDPEKSRQMFWLYVKHYYPKGTWEQWARCWNGGPKGPTKPATVKYWTKIKGVLRNGTR